MKKKPGYEGNVIDPDLDYVDYVSSTLTMLSSTGLRNYIKKAQNALEVLIKNNETDPYVIMETVNEVIKKYVYSRDSELNNHDWDMAQTYLKKIGYRPVSVKVGDPIDSYRTFFDRPIPASNGTPGTIKAIQQLPYIIEYYDESEIFIFKLAGKCTYYR